MAHHDDPSFRVSSESFRDGDTLPPAQCGASAGAGARDESPQLSWGGAPAGTRGYAVTMFDPDAPGRGGFWHWAVLDLPADTPSLPAGAGSRHSGHLPPSAFQLKNDGGSTGYMGAAPPRGGGPHRYVVTVYALDVARSGLDAGSRPAALEAKLGPHTLARASLTGIYERT